MPLPLISAEALTAFALNYLLKDVCTVIALGDRDNVSLDSRQVYFLIRIIKIMGRFAVTPSKIKVS